MKKRIKLYALLFSLIACNHFAWAQYPPGMTKEKMDSIKNAYIAKLALKNPAVRQAGFSVDAFAPTNITTSKEGDKLFKADLQSTRYIGYMNVPIAHFGKNIIGATVGFQHQTLNLTNIESFTSTAAIADRTYQRTSASLTASYTRVDSLFHLPTIYNFQGTGMIDPTTGNIRFWGTGLINTTVKKWKHASLSVVLVLSTNPTVPFPIIPALNFEATIGKGLDLNVGIQGVNLRKELGKKSSLTLANTFGGTTVLLDNNREYWPKDGMYSTFEVKSGLTFERLMTKSMILTVSAGANNTVSSNVNEQGKLRDPLVKNKLGMNGYANVGISFLPFWKGLSHK